MTDKTATNSGYDYMILLPVIFLVGLGLVVVYSASLHLASESPFQDSYYYLKKQALFCAIGFCIMILAKNIPCAFYTKLAYPLLLLSFCLLILLWVPGVGHKVGGATRWLRWSGLSFQPSELAKFSLAVYMAYSMARKGSKMESFSKGLLPHLLVAGVFIWFIVLQPDLGTAVIIACWIFLLLFVSGVNFFHLIGILSIFGLIVTWLIIHSSYRIERLLAYTNPWNNPKDIGFQIIHSFFAFGSGGIFGAGLGDSKQKLGFLPEPHTDFILSIIGEELGFIGVAIIIFVFAILIMRGLKIAFNAHDLYSSYLAFGLTCLIGLQAGINMSVVMGLLPTKGLTLPFISYGGSSLVINLLIIGILLNISSNTQLKGNAA